MIFEIYLFLTQHRMACSSSGRDPEFEQMPSIFAPDATWGGIGLGISGLENITHSLRSSTASIQFSTHTFHNPVIKLNSDVALRPLD